MSSSPPVLPTHNSPLPAAGEKTPGPTLQGYVSHDQLLNCIHCGLCTSACPTYLETGNENDSPRGRIHLMRGVEESRIPLSEKVRGHLDLCLDCRSCETACPSGVQYGQLIETFRHSARERQIAAGRSPDTWFERIVLHELFPDRRRLERLLWPAWLMQRTGLDRVIEGVGLLRLLPTPLRRMQRLLPRLRLAQKSLPAQIPPQLPPSGVRTARVGLFLGCVADAMFRHIHWATVRVLQNAGCEVVIPPRQQCCGAIEYHSGQSAAAARRAAGNIDEFTGLNVEFVLVNVAGCGAMLKEYPHMAGEFADEPERQQQLTSFSRQVRDINEFLAALPQNVPLHPLPLRVVYQDACHLRHAQQIEQPPRKLLAAIPELTILPIPEANICCGAAGSYNLQQPEMSDRLGARKIEHIIAQQPDLIATANVGCALQLQALLRQRGLSIPVVHPVELLDASQRNVSKAELLSLSR